MKKILVPIVFSMALLVSCSCPKENAPEKEKIAAVVNKYAAIQHKQIEIDGVSIFYREAGDPKLETILMLHGFPSSSHMYRNVIKELSNEYHIIAPDYPGFGFSDTPAMDQFEYTFKNITSVMDKFVTTLKMDKFYVMMQDYGGPIGMRLATINPNRISGLIVQNANMYLEGLGEWPQHLSVLMKNNDLEGLTKFKDHLISAEGIKAQYYEGAPDPSKIDPISYLSDVAFFDRKDIRKIQLSLLDNYGTNIAKYSEWQAYLREHQPPTLVVWGQNDKFFSKQGGEAFSKDLKNVETHFFDGGHFMLEEYPKEASTLIRAFLKKQ